MSPLGRPDGVRFVALRRHVQQRAARAAVGFRLRHLADLQPLQHGRIGDDADAEVHQLGADFPVGIRLNEDVAGLDVLVQDTHGMSGGEGAGRADDEIDPLLQGDLVDSTLALRPIDEIAAAT
jgi:hypothetical protein